MAAAGSSSRAANSLRMLPAGLAVLLPLRQASLHSSTSAAACSTCRQGAGVDNKAATLLPLPVPAENSTHGWKLAFFPMS